MDAFQGHYKDGTGGTYDYRSSSCSGLVVRLAVCLSFISGATRANGNYFAERVLPMLLAASLFYAHIKPCKKQYMNVIESLLYATATVVLVYTTIRFRSGNILLLIILTPSVVFVCAIAYKLLGVLGILHQIKRIVVKIRQFGRRCDDNESPEAEPHRLTHPTQYTPLLQ